MPEPVALVDLKILGGADGNNINQQQRYATVYLAAVASRL